MVQKKQTPKTKKTTAKVKKPVDTAFVNAVLAKDFKNAVLVVSILINLAVFTAWVTVQVTSVYDDQVSSLLFQNR